MEDRERRIAAYDPAVNQTLKRLTDMSSKFDVRNTVAFKKLFNQELAAFLFLMSFS